MLQIINYSDNAVAVIGDTRDYISELKSLGGRFNPRLTCGAGWIFSKKMLQKLEAFVNGIGTNGENGIEKPVRNEALKDARVYVGTYGKYNSGSIDGAWLNLIDYANKAEFLAACRELHKDESDPEFMFQDYEGIPSWMIGESHIDAEIWNLKPERDEGKQTTEQKIAILKRCGAECDIEYHAKNTALLVESSGKWFCFPKQNIKTRFCHPDEPEESVRAFYKAVKTYEYFRDENMKDLKRDIARLEKHQCTGDLQGPFVYFEPYYGTWEWNINAEQYYLTDAKKAEPMDEQTRALLLKGYKQVAKDFEKRLAAWWKRYGYENLHVWTYWRDA